LQGQLHDATLLGQRMPPARATFQYYSPWISHDPSSPDARLRARGDNHTLTLFVTSARCNGSLKTSSQNHHWVIRCRWPPGVLFKW
jgi:hypothetical protein